LRDIGDAGLEIREAVEKLGTEIAVVGLSRSRSVWPSAIVTALVTAVLVASVFWLRRPDADSLERGVTALSIPNSDFAAASRVEVSPDGRTIVYSAEVDGQSQLYRRDLDRFDALPIAGTEGASNPFFSPDGQWLGFFTRDQLKKVPLAGGSPRVICDIRGLVFFSPLTTFGRATATWAENDLVIFSAGRWSGDLSRSGLYKVDVNGGEPEILTRLDSVSGERNHIWPQTVPGSELVLFTVDTNSATGYAVEVVSLVDGTKTRLIDDGAAATYAATGHLIFMDDFFTRLVAVPFDLESLQILGARVPLIEGIRTDLSIGYSLSAAGTLVHVPRGATEGEYVLLRVDRQGRVLPLLDQPGSWTQPRISPDGSKLLVREVANECQLWIYDLERGVLSRFTFEGDNHSAEWSHDGRYIVFGRETEDGRELYQKLADGSGPADSMAPGGNDRLPQAWSPRGDLLVFSDVHEKTGFDLMVLPVTGAGGPSPLANSEFTENGGTISPDGEWVAYSSDESGRHEVYVRRLKRAGGKTQISKEGGTGALWSHDGSEIFYSSSNRMMMVEVTTDPDFRARQPQELFRGNFAWDRSQNYDISPDGEWFVVTQESGSASLTSEIRVTLNWLTELDSLVQGNQE
jgi:serine/threonine-protein kinase